MLCVECALGHFYVCVPNKIGQGHAQETGLESHRVSERIGRRSRKLQPVKGRRVLSFPSPLLSSPLLFHLRSSPPHRSLSVTKLSSLLNLIFASDPTNPLHRLADCALRWILCSNCARRENVCCNGEENVWRTIQDPAQRRVCNRCRLPGSDFFDTEKALDHKLPTSARRW
jgi:hypothetical protein